MGNAKDLETKLRESKNYGVPLIPAYVIPTDPVTGLPIGVLNGGTKVAVVNEPARDLMSGWGFGSDAILSTLTVNTANNSLFMDMSLLNASQRQIVIINGSSGGAVDYGYSLQFSRNGLGVATDDTYTVATVAAGAKAQILPVAIPAGYDRYCRLVITPTTGQAGAQLTFKAYLTGRGG